MNHADMENYLYDEIPREIPEEVKKMNEHEIRQIFELEQKLLYRGYDLDYNPNDEDNKPWSVGPVGPWEPGSNPEVLLETATFAELAEGIERLGILNTLDDEQETPREIPERVKEAILRQFGVQKIRFDDGTGHWQVNFIPDTECGDGTFYMAFEEDGDGTLRLLDYVGE